MKKNQKVWKEVLDKNYCKEQEYTGNRPCDNGNDCDACHGKEAEIIYQSYMDGYKEKAKKELLTLLIELNIKHLKSNVINVFNGLKEYKRAMFENTSKEVLFDAKYYSVIFHQMDLHEEATNIERLQRKLERYSG